MNESAENVKRNLKGENRSLSGHDIHWRKAHQRREAVHDDRHNNSPQNPSLQDANRIDLSEHSGPLLSVDRISLHITFTSARKFPEEFKGFFSAPKDKKCHTGCWAFHHNPSFEYVNSLTSSLVPALWRYRPPYRLFKGRISPIGTADTWRRRARRALPLDKQRKRLCTCL